MPLGILTKDDLRFERKSWYGDDRTDIDIQWDFRDIQQDQRNKERKESWRIRLRTIRA